MRSERPAVPRRISRLGRVLIALGLLFGVGLVALAVAWTALGGTIAREVEIYLNRAVFDADSTRIRVGDVGGFPFGQVDLRDVAVERRAGETWFPFVGASRLRVRFDPLDIVSGRFRFATVDAEDLVFTLRARGKDSSDFLLPLVRRGEGGSGKRGFGFSIGRLDVKRGLLALDIPGVPLRLADVSGATRLVFDDGVDLTLDRLSGALPDTLGRLLVSGGRIEAHEGTRIDDLEIRWDDADLVVDGRVAEGEPGGGELRVTGRRLSMGRLGGLLGIPNLEPGFVERGSCRILPAEPLRLELEGEGRWDVWSLTGVAAGMTVTDDVVEVDGGRAVTRGITVRDVAVRAPRWAADLEVSGSFTDLVTDSLTMIPVAVATPARLAGRARVRFPDRERWAETMHVEAELQAGRVLDIAFEGATARLAGGEAGWAIDTLGVRVADAVVSARGSVSERDVNLVVAFAGGLDALRRLGPLPPLSGRADVRGTLHGPPDDLLAEAVGRVDGFAGWNTTVDVLEIGRAEGALGRGATGAGREVAIDATARGILVAATVPFDAARVALTLGADRADLHDLAVSRGDTTAAARGSVAWTPREVTLDLASLDGRFDGHPVRLAAPARLVWRDGRLATPGLAVVAPRGEISVEGAFAPETRYLDARFAVRGFDPAPLMPDSTRLPVGLDALDGTFALEGTAPLFDGSARVTLRGLEAKGARFDSLVAAVCIEGPAIVVEDARLHRGGGVVAATGDVLLPAPLYTALEAEVFGPSLDPGATRWNVDVTARDVRLEEWFAHLPRATRPRGGLRGTLRVRGSSAHPEIELDAGGAGLLWQRLEADSLMVRAGSVGGEATLEALDYWSDGQLVRARGRIPVALSFKPFVRGLGEGDLDVVVSAEKGSLEGLRLTPWVERASGSFDGELRVTGSPRKPLVTGSIRAEGGEVQIRDRDEVLKDVRAEIIFEGDLVKVLAAEADLGGGRVNAMGTYRLWADELESYELIVTANNAVVREDGRYAARVSGRIRLTPTRAPDGRIYPFATGKITVDRAEYIGSLEPRDIVVQKPQPILYEVDVDAPSRIFVRTAELEAQLAADLTVRQEPRQWIVRGEMEILDGTYQLFLRKFRIEEGRLTWADAGTPLPTMDVSAETLDRDAVITVHWTGRADEPVIKFGARDPDTGEDLGLPEDEIIRRLALGEFGTSLLSSGSGEEAGAGSPGTMAIVVAGSTLFVRDLERALLDQIGFFDDLNLSPGYSESEDGARGIDFRVEVRKWLTPQLSLRYEQGLSRNFDQDVAVEYRLGRTVLLRGQSSRERLADKASATQEYNLDVKFRFEY